jgi:List-Bact-rpt repeat protein
MKLRHDTRRSLALPIALLALALGLVSGAATQPGAASRWAVHDLELAEARALLPGVPAAMRSARSSATWCGTARQTDHAPNAVAGNPVHWIYAIPADGQDGFSTWASAMQADAESIDAWWRANDPARTLRSDLAQFACGQQIDISMIRLSQSSGQLSSVDTRFGRIADALIALRFSSDFTKYVVYYDGPVEPEICGQGGSDRSGLGFAVVYPRACAGVPLNTTVAHEVLHTIGAVAPGAPHMCPEPDDGHVCDDPHDMMYPYGDETPITGLTLDIGRDDYYGHSGAWRDAQDSPWLVRLDRQAPLTVAITGPGSVTADVPGLLCAQTCTTTWSADTGLALTARPSSGAKLVRWGGACSGSGACRVVVGRVPQVSALFGPSTYRLTVAVAGRGAVRSSQGGLSCPPRCSRLVASYASLRLTASPAKGWRFRSWTGACRGTRPACTLPMTTAANARAVFVRR